MDEVQPITSQPAQTPPGYAGPITTTSSGGDTATATSRKPAKGEMQAINEAEAASLAAADAQKAAGEAKETGAAGTADLQDKAADLMRQQAVDAAAKAQDMQDRIEAARAAHSQAYADLDGEPYHNLFDTYSTGKKIAMAIGMGLTGASGNAAANEQLNSYMDNLVKNDFAQQKAKREDQINIAKMRGEDVNQLYKQWEMGNAQEAVKEQKAREAIAQEILAQGPRAGIPVDKLMNTVAYQNMIAGAKEKKAAALGHFDSVYQSNRELNPKVSVVEGKLQGGKGGKTTGPIAEVPSSDVDFVTKNPLTPQELDAARRMVTQDPGLIEKFKGFISGGQLPDYLAKLSPDSQAKVQAAVRLATPVAEVVTNNKRAGTNKDALTSVLLSHIPSTTDTPEAGKRKIDSLNKVTGRVGATQEGVTPSAPRAEPAGLPPGAIPGRSKSTGKRGYQLNGVFHATE